MMRMFRNLRLHHWEASLRIKPRQNKLFSTDPASMKASEKLPKLTVALVGRPNVGKSTLFNRLTRSNTAIVSAVPGTTRDRKEGMGYIAGLPIAAIDTGGLDDRGTVKDHIQSQVQLSFQEADVILFLIDAKEGLTSLDTHFVKWLRKSIGESDKSKGVVRSAVDMTQLADFPVDFESVSAGTKISNKEVVLIANKTEGAHLSDRVLNTIADSLSLGLGSPLLISASHGDGLADLAQVLIRAAKARHLDAGETATYKKTGTPEKITVEERTIQLAVMGKPNVGKSTLINAVIGQERLVAGPTAGLTRDAIHVEWEFRQRLFRLVDTAGLSRVTPDKRLLASGEEKKRMRLMETTGRSVVKLPGMEVCDPEDDPSQFSVEVSELSLISALNALRFAQVVVVVVEGGQGHFTHIDLQLARKCLAEGRALMVVANKSDLVEDVGVGRREYEEGVRKHCKTFMREFGEVPVVACSAIAGKGVDRVLSTAIEVHDAWSKRLDTWVLNKWLEDLMVATPTPRAGGRNVKIKYITQIKSRPPTFALFSNTDEIPGFFERFLRSKLQHDMNLQGVPIRFIVRKTKGMDVEKSLLKQGKQTRRGSGNASARTVGPKRKDPRTAFRLKEKRDTERRKNTRIKRKRSSK